MKKKKRSKRAEYRWRAKQLVQLLKRYSTEYAVREMTQCLLNLREETLGEVEEALKGVRGK